MHKNLHCRFLVIVISATFFRSSAIVCSDTPVRRRVVDVYSLRDGTRLLGVSMSPSDDGAPRVVIRGKWLHKELPNLYSQLSQSGAGQRDDHSTVITQLSEHLVKLRAARPGDVHQIGFLQERLTDLKSKNEEKTIFDLVVLKISPSIIRRKFRQKTAVQKIGGLALLNAIPDTETLSLAEVSNALQKRAAESQLITELPPPPNTDDSDADEFQRLLVDTERLFGKVCRLIHHNGQFISAERDATNLQELIPQMLQGQLQSGLADLLNGAAVKPERSTPLKSAKTLDPAAVDIAADRRLVEVSQFDLDPTCGAATVRIVLYFKAPGKTTFQRITEAEGNASINDVSPEEAQRIRDDPRIKQVTKLFSALGTGTDNLAKALSIGAAVEIAQIRAKQKLTVYISGSPDGANGELQILRTTLTKLPPRKQAE